MTHRIAVIGATGSLGRRLVARLRARGLQVIAVARSSDRLARLSVLGRCAYLTDIHALRSAIADTRCVVSCAHARFTQNIIDALPADLERLVLIGSTRHLTRFPDSAAREVADAQAAFLRCGQQGVMIHPSMIYGAEGENNVRRVAAYIRRFGTVPLPLGAPALVQPIHIDDVVSCLEAALFRPDAPGSPIVVAGPAPMPYSSFIEAIALAIGRRVRIIRVPSQLLIGVAAVTRIVPGIPTIEGNEVQRLLEDKAFDISDMRHRLGIEPVELSVGLAQMFAGQPMASGRLLQRGSI